MIVLLALVCAPVWADGGLPTSDASLAPRPSLKPTASTIDPAFYFLRDLLARHGAGAAILGDALSSRGSTPPAGVGALLRFDRPLMPAELAALARQGLRFAGRHPNTARLGPIYRAWVPWEALDALEGHPRLLRAEAAWRPGRLQPLELTGALAGATDAHRLPIDGVDGAGTLIATIDSGIDVLHPAFFHADGGAFDWIDVNGSGRFEPGADAVDLNRNGEADRNELLRVLDATTIVDYVDLTLENDDGDLDAGRDWLYADMNRDQARNVGPAAGFTEEQPGYGEPLFVVDDVDLNGALDPGEKLIQLKTSKIRKYVDDETVYVRGQNLIDAAGADGLRRAFHGTGAAGILVGGQVGHHRRVGLAPRAELIVYGLPAVEAWQDAVEARFIEDAVTEGVDVLLHEWNNPYTQPHDGSTNLEAAMALARGQGVLQITPTGNLNLTGKHLRRLLDVGEAPSLAFEVDPGRPIGDEVLPIRRVYGTLQWRGGHQPSLRLRGPDEETVPLVPGEPDVVVSGARAQVTHETTSRGTGVTTFYLWSADDETPLQAGVWRLEIDALAADEVLFARVNDGYPSWSGGVRWTEGEPGAGSLSYPATADAAVGVVAFGGRHAFGGPPEAAIGELRPYSGRGPTVDGRNTVALAAPDDPFVPLAATPRLQEAG